MGSELWSLANIVINIIIIIMNGHCSWMGAINRRHGVHHVFHFVNVILKNTRRSLAHARNCNHKIWIGSSETFLENCPGIPGELPWQFSRNWKSILLPFPQGPP